MKGGGGRAFQKIDTTMSETRALELLHLAYGAQARFRSGQWNAIQSAMRPAGRTLVVQRTGWGKSVVYFLATRLLREQGLGPTLLISPLLALMRNQVDIAAQFGVHAVSINSTNPEEWDAIHDQVINDRVDLLLISPERLGNARYADSLMPFLEPRVALLVIDEAHCISDWGHDFRPDYRRILRTVNRLPAAARILGTTATANDRVISDVRAQLGESLEVQRGSLTRESLEIEVWEPGDQAERLAWLAHEIPRMPGSGIVYTLTVNDACRVAQWLRMCGIAAEEYHADRPHPERLLLESRFRANQVKCLVATTALGMGYDKSDVSFVIHFQRPGSIIGYYQQIGRAGRSLDRARVVLLSGTEDNEIAEYFIRTAFPGPACFTEVLEAIKASPRNNLDTVTARTNHPRGQVEKALKLLAVEEVVRRTDAGFAIVRQEWEYASLRAEQITAQRRRELEQMKQFVAHAGCRMEFLARSLDDPSPYRCGRCDRCKPRSPVIVSRNIVLQAVAYLRGDHQVIPRKSFYPPVDGAGRAKIPAALRVEPGLALCVYNDAGWGRLVREGKYQRGEFSDELVAASADLIRTMEVQPEWIAWVPSLSRPLLVASFACRLAAALGLHAAAAVRKVAANSEQKAMQNATRQFLNIRDAFEVDAAVVREEPCLLMDDVADSGWTLTTIGIKLREAGCRRVVPFALAVAKSKE